MVLEQLIDSFQYLPRIRDRGWGQGPEIYCEIEMPEKGLAGARAGNNNADEQSRPCSDNTRRTSRLMRRRQIKRVRFSPLHLPRYSLCGEHDDVILKSHLILGQYDFGVSIGAFRVPRPVYQRRGICSVCSTYR